MNKKHRLLLVVMFALAVSAVILLNRQLIKDHYVVRTNQLSEPAENLKNDIALTRGSDFIYRASVPEVFDAEDFNQACRSSTHEHSIVLGCYTRQRIFIFNVVDQRLNGVQQVTAAHELLHAEYERMSSSKKDEVNKLLRTTAAGITDQRFLGTLAEYKRSSPDQIDNELHSIIGTEIAVIPQALEDHYKQYFTNRSKIVAYAEGYSDAFNQLNDQIKEYDQRLIELKEEKDDLELVLDRQQSQVQSERSELERLKAEDGDAYNAAVPSYNQLVRDYNQNIQRVRAIISEYNDLVNRRNQLAATQNDLSRQLDSSSYEPIN